MTPSRIFLAKFQTFFLLLLLVGISGSTCKSPRIITTAENMFSVEDDKKMGKIIALEMEKTSPVLNEKGHEIVYQYLQKMRDRILGTGMVQHARDFDWKIKIMHDDAVENAFCAPGGYIFIFTGLLKFVDSEDQLAGVLAHEIAHAANRHYTRQITSTMPARRITEALLGKSEGMKMLTVGLASLKYSRVFETEADEYSVKYLCGLGLRADGAAGFFKKIEKLPGHPPQWLSTHPHPKHRVAHVQQLFESLECRGTQTNSEDFKKMLRALPK